MATTTQLSQIKVRRDTDGNWHAQNPVLALGEPGLNITTNKLKFGNGVTAWNDLQYFANSAPKLETPRAINGVLFDGTDDITITASASGLSGTTLPANIINSSLTTVGTLTNLRVTNTIQGSINGNAATVTNGIYSTSSIYIGTTSVPLNRSSSSQTLTGVNIGGNSATTTKLATSVNINNISFDGSSDITIPAASNTLVGSALPGTVLSSSLTSLGTLSALNVSGTGDVVNVTGNIVQTGNLSVTGNLTVTGATTSIVSNILEVKDINITIAKGLTNAALADGAGITIDGASATFTYAASGDKFVSNKPIQASISGTVTGNIIGDVLAGNGVGVVIDNGTDGTDAKFYGTVQTASQPLITSVGTLTSLSVTNAFSAGSIQASSGVFINNNTMAVSVIIPSGTSGSSIGPIRMIPSVTVTLQPGGRHIVF
jgi:hypothetical protein